ncbi:MAG: phenylalanine--tRNA ligase subunit beta [Erysipelotrichaceae bacterium]|nr:phenylalanine--tRNA ligase subunit beta [Erysipelotrichaceae bacterium]
MKLSLNWLSDFIDLKGLDTNAIVDQMVKCGFEVEAIDKMSEGTNLVVGKVIECKDHPNSDHLHVTKTDIGSEVLDIVCGAPNCREGLKVIVAKVGAKLPGGEIKAGVIRGEASNGMLCSLKELGISDDLLPEDSPSHSGIEELDDRFEVGDTDILKKLGYDDTILDVSIYANRPDCLSMYAMAKEMGAILDREVRLPDFEGKADIGEESDFILKSESANCPHFLAKVVNHVTIKESPEWMKAHLRANGVKCINNLVDISNYVMLETGQPLHFYDLRSNPAKEITVRDDYEGVYTALDGIDYQIEKGDLMITSEGKPIGIAGIMGGDNTKILDDTTGLIIEAALFDHAQIRRTSNRLGLQTEAAARFAKGLEPMAQNKAVDRAVELLIELADASGFEKTVEYGKADYEPYQISETLSHLNALIGKEYTMDEAVSVMKRLGFECKVEGETFITTIPSHRASDLKIREDIDEEIVRLTDFDDLTSTLPLMPQTVGKLSNIQNIRRVIRDLLTKHGLYDTVNYTLVNEKYIEESLLPSGDAVAMISPLSDARKYIRTSLMNSLLEALSYNLDHYNSDLGLFEISKIYTSKGEEERLGIVMEGDLIQDKVKHLSLKTDFYVVKGLLRQILSTLGFEMGRVSIKENDLDTKHFHPYQSAVLMMDGKILGIFGKLHPAYLKTLKLNDVYYAELMLDVLAQATPSKVKAPVISKYPSVSRDISLMVKEEVKAADLLASIRKVGGHIVKKAEVFDVYQGEHIEKGYKSVSLSIVYEDNEKTLKTEDVNAIHGKIVEELKSRFEAIQR